MVLKALFAQRRVYAINKRSPLPQNDSPLKGFDYSGLLPRNISFIPTEDIIDNWRVDYDSMRESMIYGHPLKSLFSHPIIEKFQTEVENKIMVITPLECSNSRGSSQLFLRR